MDINNFNKKQLEKIVTIHKRNKNLVTDTAKELQLTEHSLRKLLNLARSKGILVEKGDPYEKQRIFKTKKDLENLVSALRKNNGNRSLTAKLLKISRDAVGKGIRKAEEEGFEIPEYIPEERQSTVDEELLKRCWQVFEKYGYNLSNASEALNLSRSTLRNYIEKAEKIYGYQKISQGKNAAQKAETLPLPSQGEVHRYILTCAQNNTQVHEPTWNAIQAIAKFYNAEIKISTFTYVHNQEGSAKRNTGKTEKSIWYDPKIENYVSDKFEELAPGIVWCGNMNTLPTATSPLTGFESYTGRASGIFPHPKFAMVSIPSHKKDPPKFNYTTGTITKRNYIQKRSGIRAEFAHCYGALLVEVDEKGRWFARQLNADVDGVIYDLDIKARPDGKVELHNGVEAIVWGDIHVAAIDKTVKNLAWNKGNMLDTLRPKHQAMHDILDFRARNGHTLKKGLIHDRFREFTSGRDSVEEEIDELCDFLQFARRDWCKTVIVNSNHDNFMIEWLRIADYRHDPINAIYFLKSQLFVYESIAENPKKPVNILKWAIENKVEELDDVIFLNEDDSFIICKDSSGGIEIGMHGDMGPNGTRGTPSNLAKMGRKLCIGHIHSSGIYDGVYVAGLSGDLDQGYNKGPSSWSHSHIVVYPNGKRAIVTMKNGNWRA
jgi:hypothetical protein